MQILALAVALCSYGRWAIAIAIFASVTVSIAEVMIGVLSIMSPASLVPRLTILGVQLDSAGIRRTSSNVSPSFTNLFE